MKTLTFLFFSLVATLGYSQESKGIQWLTFEQLEDSLEHNPKKVFISFYTEWCTYCRKMDRKVYTNGNVRELLKSSFYAVRFDAESIDTVAFSGRLLVNEEIDKSRNPVHQLVKLLATRQGAFVPPTLVFLNEKFEVVSRHFEYKSSSQLNKLLQKHVKSTR